MTKSELKSRLDKELEDFKADAKSNWENASSKGPVTAEDMAKLAQYTYYALAGFRDVLIGYLD